MLIAIKLKKSVKIHVDWTSGKLQRFGWIMRAYTRARMLVYSCWQIGTCKYWWHDSWWVGDKILN